MFLSGADIRDVAGVNGDMKKRGEIETALSCSAGNKTSHYRLALNQPNGIKLGDDESLQTARDKQIKVIYLLTRSQPFPEASVQPLQRTDFS